MRNPARTFPGVVCTVAALLLVAVSCTRKETTTTTTSTAVSPSSTASEPPPAPVIATSGSTASSVAVPAAATPAAIATAEGETPGVSATIRELKRSSGGTVSLKLVITNASDKQLNTGYNFVDPDNSVLDFSSFGGVQLIDPVGKKKYFVARDAAGKCVCSQSVKDIAPGESANVWAKFPAPPADVQQVSVIVPHFSPMDDVPISAQ